MSSYIGGVQIESQQYKIGSTLYGICNSLATDTSKKIILNSFDQLLTGITVHIKFTAGNSVSSGVTLQFYASDSAANPNINYSAISVTGNCVCEANGIVSFTLDEVSDTKYWRVNDSYKIEEGTTNGTIKVNGQEISIHGLGTAAYTASTAYATAAQGTLADNAMPVSGGTFTGAISGPAVDDNSASGTLATVDYVKQKTGGLAGLQGAMHFKGSTNSMPPSGTYESGDVVLGPNDKEYVYDGTNWIELGDEGSFVLADSQTTGSIGSASGWSAGSASSATVSNGILQLVNSTAPTLTVTSTSVIVPTPASSGS